MNRRLLGHVFTLLHVDRVRLNALWNYDHVVSPYFRIYYIDEGTGYILNAREKCKLEKGHLYIIPSFTLCHLRCDHYLSQHFLHFFEESPEGISLFENNRKVIKVTAAEMDIVNFNRLLEINPGRGINRSDNPKVYEKDVYYKSYRDLNKDVSDAVSLETQGIILQLLSRFLGAQFFRPEEKATMPRKIQESISFIQRNIREDLNVGLLAKRANLHQDYFSRLFLHHTGERPLPFIQAKRIERAQYLMATTQLSYTQIAEATGFESLPYFSKIFKKVTSLTPGEYRKKNELV